MGITIHYQARLRKPSEVENLIDEVADIAKTLGWETSIVRKDLKGICVTPPECETVLLLFDERGGLRNPHGTGRTGVRTVSVKTQLASVDVHIALVKLLLHLEKRYFSRFKLTDEGEYWPSGDRQKLIEKREFLNRAMRRVERGLSRQPAPSPGETNEQVAGRIEEVIAGLPDEDEEQARKERARLIGPQLPDDEELKRWGVEDWIRHFELHDRHRDPMLRAMLGRDETEEALAEALKWAEEISERDDRAAQDLMRRMDRKYGTGGDDEPWKESGPSDEEDGSFQLPPVDVNREALQAECPPFGDALEFLKEVSRRKRGVHPIPPALHYVKGLLLTAVVGVHMGHYWAREEGHSPALPARYRIAANRFDTIARVVRAFPAIGLADLHKEAARIAAGFRRASKGRP